MGKNTSRISITDQETGEVFELNASSLVNDTVGILMSWRRNVIQSTVWSQLSEDQQQEAIDNALSLAQDLVNGLVEIIATGKNEVIHALLDNFKIKDGTVTVTAKGIADNGALLALNSVGDKALKIVVADASQFNQEGELPTADPDQQEMDVDQEPQEPKEERSFEDLYDAARVIVIRDGKASTSYIQRKLSIGYNKAAKILEALEEKGVVSAPDHVGKRQILEGDGLSDEQVEDIAKDMDADIDQMEEPEDLHTEAASDQKVEGYHARMNGQHSNESPYDIDSPEREEWYLGWKEADALEEAPELAEPEAAPEQEPEEEPEPEQEQADAGEADAVPDQSPLEQGQQARVRGEGPDSNPFDGGTDEHAEWVKGYKGAGEEIEMLIDRGFNVAKSGGTPDDCPYKKATDAERFWLEGFNKYKGEAS